LAVSETSTATIARPSTPTVKAYCQPAQASSFEPDVITREVIALVNARLAGHPGLLDSFAWPVIRSQSLQSFIDDRLPLFERLQDAMWSGDPLLYHYYLSAAFNMKLLNPREVVTAVELAYQTSVEGLICQIFG
jgi:deoxyribodipyrimidine photolyase-related protein